MKKRRSKRISRSKMLSATGDFGKELWAMFDRLLDKHRGKISMELNNELCDLRNSIKALLHSWIGTKKLESEFGITLPLHAKPISIDAYLRKQARSFHKVYIPCEVCGETRITNECHIIPQSDGGPYDPENFVYLCPTHHHLFDHFRLSKDEWEKIDFTNKMPAAQEYVEKVRLPTLQEYWKKREEEKT